MPRVERMGWVPTMKRWQKKFRGRLYAVSCRQLGCEPTREASREAANEWWDKKEADLTGEPARVAAIARGAAAVAGLQPAEMINLARQPDAARRILAILGFDPASPDLDPERVGHALDDVRLAQFAADNFVAAGGAELAKVIARAAGHGEKSIRTTADEWLAIRQSHVAAGKITAPRWQTISDDLAHFVRHLGPDAGADAVNAGSWQAFYVHLSGDIVNGRRNSETSKRIINTAARFVRWGYEREYFALPRNLDSPDLRFSGSRDPETIETFTTGEIRKLLDTATERTRLYLLLGCNCGMYPADIASLKKTEVDWDAGYVARKRSKMRKTEKAPIVRYKLWPETLTLLRKYANNGPRPEALVSRAGGPLADRSLVAGKMHHFCLIKTAYRRLQQATQIDKPFRTLRKTCADLLRNYRDQNGGATLTECVDVYLAHSPKTMADRRYTRLWQPHFDVGIAWLWGQVIIGNNG